MKRFQQKKFSNVGTSSQVFILLANLQRIFTLGSEYLEPVTSQRLPDWHLRPFLDRHPFAFDHIKDPLDRLPGIPSSAPYVLFS